MKIGDIVSTPDGLGEIVTIESKGARSERFGVVLDKDTPTDPVKYYYPNELKLVYSPK